MTIASLEADEIATIEGYLNEQMSQSRLVEMGLLPGTQVRLIKKIPLNGPVEIKVRNFYLSLRRKDAQNILIKKSPQHQQ